MKTKIDWCDEVWNPVWGCKRNCKFGCYAKRFHKRFARKLGITTPFSKPVWLEKNFNRKFSNKPKRIFVGSMSDIYYWKPLWILKTIEVIKSSIHTFIFLTKDIRVYEKYTFPQNCWLGVSFDGENYTLGDYDKIFGMFFANNINFVSLEPLLNYVNPNLIPDCDWLIVGGLTPKSIHKKEWIDIIIELARGQHIPIFLKENLHYPKKIQEFPKCK